METLMGLVTPTSTTQAGASCAMMCSIYTAEQRELLLRAARGEVLSFLAFCRVIALLDYPEQA